MTGAMLGSCSWKGVARTSGAGVPAANATGMDETKRTAGQMRRNMYLYPIRGSRSTDYTPEGQIQGQTVILYVYIMQ